jgi:hypothetical protein
MRLKKCVERNLNINRIKYLKEGAENSNVYLLGFVFYDYFEFIMYYRLCSIKQKEFLKICLVFMKQQFLHRFKNIYVMKRLKKNSSFLCTNRIIMKLHSILDCSTLFSLLFKHNLN